MDDHHHRVTLNFIFKVCKLMSGPHAESGTLLQGRVRQYTHRPDAVQSDREGAVLCNLQACGRCGASPR